MAESELTISGIGVSRQVVSAIVSAAAEKVEGVASVGQRATASNLVSVFFATGQVATDAETVEADVVDGGLRVTVHLTVLYGYPFTQLAAAVREAVAQAVREQMGVEVAAVDVCIDSIVFPKE
ncbi:MAG: Asp23/Gls24 family envelope stress response protein [Olegusella sp.]|nr:Asp23/Gls24 family envelope stress response protein [Olegusella sp.]